MSFGLSNAPSMFMRIIVQKLCHFLDRFASSIFDDILVFSLTLDEHLSI